jgi:formate dehydrogenase subunit gamma
LAAHGRTVVHEDELLRHPVYTRVLHWSVAILFILALLSGFGIYSAWLFRWISPLFGGGATMRLLHPWFGVGFVIVFFFQFLNWLQPMLWTSDDSRWMRHMKAYISNDEIIEPEYVGFFNGGQKSYFWAIVFTSVGFLITGILMWFPEFFGRPAVYVSYIIHDI